MSDSPSHHLGSELASGIIWNYTAFVLAKSTMLVATLILARLLTPSEFGVVGIALIVMTGLDILRDFGVGSALIFHQEDGERAANAAFVLSISFGAVLFAANWVAAPFIVQLFHTDGADQATLATNLLRVLGLCLLLSGVGSTPDALLRKDLAFRRRLVPELGRGLIKGVVQVALALLGFGAWSLVLGQVVGELAAAGLVWHMARWRPSWKYDAHLMRSMLRYGVQIVMVGGVGWLIADIDYIVIGATLGEIALGIYTLAFRIPELALRNLTESVGNVAFPALSRLQKDRDALKSSYLHMQRSIFFVLAPLGCGLCAVAPALIRVVFPPSWEPAILPMQILSIYMLLGGLGHMPGIIYKAIGRPDILTRWGVAKVALLAPTLYWCATTHGVVGVAWGQLIVRVATVTLDFMIVRRFIGAGVASVLGELRGTALAALAMTVVVRLVLAVDSSGHAGLSLAAAVVIGASVYFGSSWVFERRTVLVFLTYARNVLKRSPVRLTPGAT